ncbi:MAG: DUF3253 domain-containing protein, partial [Dokdonella sp.]
CSASNAEGTDSLTIRRALELTDDGFMGDAFAERIRECLLELLIARGPGRTICVSEAAQTLGTRSGYHWHDLMRPVRMISAQLAEAGSIEALQQEEIVDIRVARGPVRLRLRALPGQRSAQVG